MSDAVIGGRYRLLERLAVGGMGTVWKAWDDRLRRPVAIKQLHVQPGLSGPAADVAVARAMREGRLTARLHHPNAVKVYDVVDDNGQPCLVMQYVPSTSLEAIVRERGPRPPAEVARIGTQVAAALAAAHRVGIVHRDVKPGNILIAEDGTALITDFGISHGRDDVLLTSTGMVTGTPAYLAPEIARGGESTDASDVFSLGSTLFMAAEGTPPFGLDPNPMAMLHRVASGPAIPMAHSSALAPALRSMMAPDPAARPDMVAVANLLASALAAPPAPPAPTAVITAPPTRHRPDDEPPSAAMTRALPPASSTRAPTWIPIAAAGVVVVAAIVLGLVLIANRTDSNHNAAPPAPTQTTSTPSTAGSSTSSSATSHPPTPSAPTATELVQAIDDYYSLVPGDLDAGWQRLTPTYQQDTGKGRASYDAYWHTIDHVMVSGQSATPPGTVVVTLTYYFKDGHATADRTRFGMVREDGVLKIDSSEVLSSRPA